MCDVSKLSQSIQIFAANLEQHKTLPFALSVAKLKVWTIVLSSTVCDGNKRFISPLDTTCWAHKHSPGHVMLHRSSRQHIPEQLKVLTLLLVALMTLLCVVPARVRAPCPKW